MVVSSISAAALSAGWYWDGWSSSGGHTFLVCITSHPGQRSLLPFVWVVGKTAWSLVNTCHSERFRGHFSWRCVTQMSCLQLLQLQLHMTALNVYFRVSHIFIVTKRLWFACGAVWCGCVIIDWLIDARCSGRVRGRGGRCGGRLGAARRRHDDRRLQRYRRDVVPGVQRRQLGRQRHRLRRRRQRPHGHRYIPSR